MWVRLICLGVCLAVFMAACQHGRSTRKARMAAGPSLGFVHTVPEGYRMRARIAESLWEASEMRAFDNTGGAVRIEGVSSGTSIGFSLWLPRLKTGSRIGFYAGSPAELILQGSGNIWEGTSGEVQILRIDPYILEGNFHFSAITAGTDSILLVTDGYFRLPLDGPEP